MLIGWRCIVGDVSTLYRLISRRMAVILFTFVPVLLLSILGTTVPIPYVAELPGRVQDVLANNIETGSPIISITGAPVYETNGSLFMTSVGLITGLTLFEALSLWSSGESEIVPKALIFPPTKTEQEVSKENIRMFSGSEDNATLAALSYLSLDPKKVHVSINLPHVQGPSAGLIFSLGIVNKLTKNGITDGSSIAGTGEISSNGEIGDIGGITLKLLGAQKAGAQYFLVPSGNCPEALTHAPSGLKLIKVSTLAEAVEDLHKITKNQAVLTC